VTGEPAWKCSFWDAARGLSEVSVWALCSGLSPSPAQSNPHQLFDFMAHVHDWGQ